MDTLISVAVLVLPLVGLLVVGIGLWALGQWLRRRGLGDRLDQIDTIVTKAQGKTGRVVKPLGGAFVGIASAMSRIPFFGSKRSRQMWDDLGDAERQRQELGELEQQRQEIERQRKEIERLKRTDRT